MKAFRYHSLETAAAACATRILDCLRSPSASTLAISGGLSPKGMFEVFARTPFDWEKVHVFWVDERVVPPTDDQSNFKLAFDTWLGPVNFPRANIHRVEAELGAEEAAAKYHEDIRRYFDLKEGDLPSFDVLHLGMGPDGHTASLFPGDPLIDDHSGIATSLWAQKMNQWRVTLLPGVIEAANNIEMLVEAQGKESVLRQVLEGEYKPRDYPAQIAARGDNACWFIGGSST